MDKEFVSIMLSGLSLGFSSGFLLGYISGIKSEKENKE